MTKWDPDGVGPQPELVIVGGGFTAISGVPTSNIAAYDPTSGTWSALGSGTNGTVWALATLPNGDLAVGGSFTVAGGAAIGLVARWNGTSWSALGPGTSGGVFPYVSSLALLPNGDLVAGGSFSFMGGVAASNIARWDGTSWAAVGSGTNGYVGRLKTAPNGDLIVLGGFTTAGVTAPGIARWNGVSWSAIGAGPALFASDSKSALAIGPNNEIVVGTSEFNFVSATARVWRWSGSGWSIIGTFTYSVQAAVNELSFLPNGDLLAGGAFGPATSPGEGLQRRIGTSWSSLQLPGPGNVLASVPLANGDRLFGGNLIGFAPRGQTVILTTTCGANTSSTGSGCAGSGGPNVLSATNLPWTGSTFRATATGLTNSALALSLVGLTTQSVPLLSLLPQGVAGCTLHVSTEAIQLLLPMAGSVDTQLAIPNSTAFAGVVLHHQVVAGELNAQNAITAVTSTNALTLTIGSL